MAAAVAEHAQATSPQDAALAERRLRAQAGQVAAGMQGGAATGPPSGAGDRAVGDAGYAVPPSTLAPADTPIDQRASGTELPADYDDRGYDGRRAEDWVQPVDEDERLGR